ncbi:Leucine-rich repeat and calponin homology domain-containing protein 2,Leucine-rich repeat and calponin homology domain-containing protein 1,Leucine-rich repeat and calponin homology domain-containing protein 4,Leucine-rich repeat and calponin homology domain-containing protein 3 [Mytilus coruscus]|uniref:Calponin-homology (CH) domain-containing protein n=1 Tax=Mytilus coruscus TaxID=42192 RepID=A0A6J8DZM1_MYTCO|nr:Leucine-rich repeat and calponin homology domain-containing protein 2,Leucine-rich repeat and calponin homology domain-containing protein 1,Leucine-rich repeat and calponin homology domain-containing protein 4,Leucine-rich repeat and calponin homology domain-containing protein 3 [Mytilus coruscus]
MATTFSTGTQSPTSHKPLEKIFEEAQSTGAVCLCGRKLREYPKISSRYDLIDTISADLSKNRFSEVPKEVCDHAMLEELNCYHNVIKAIPEAIGRLQNLTFINLSRNQLVVIPPFICELVSLEVLIASHNKLISLPEEMGVLDKLMEIDVSCNEISQLPPQIGDLKSLKSLNVRRNMLIELPIELSKLSLRKIDFSNNRISTIPTAFRKIETLEEIVLDSNPLTMPPAHLCTKGKKHIMKYLQIEAIKEDRRRGVLNEAEMKRLVRKSLPVTQTSDEFRNILESPEKWKRHTVLSSDSGYSTTDSIEKCGWSASDANSDMERANLLALRSAEMLKDHRVPINGHMQSPPHVYARKSENSPSSNPEPVKTSVPQNIYGQYGNNYKDSSGHYNNTDYQSNNVNGPMMYRSNFSNSSNENQNYSQNTYSNSPGYSQSSAIYSQSSAIYSQNNEVTSPNSSRQQPQYSSQSPNNQQQYGQYTTNNGQRSESKYTPMSPTHSRYTTSPNTFQYTSQLNSGQNVNYRVKPPPVVTNQEFNPEASPTSPRTPKTPTPGYYQSGQVYSPTYGGYSTGPNSPNAPITPVNTTPKDMENEISRELQRQQADYNRKKQQAEQIRMQHEEELRRQEDEEEKENRRRAALRLQEEQRMLLERQMEEERQREELRMLTIGLNLLLLSLIKSSNPEASPFSKDTKTPTPGYYQSGQVYSPTYGGYSTGPNSPNAPITPVNTTPKDMENEISRELQRQQADYNRKKQQAEQIRMQHEEELRRQEDEEEKENRRRAALRLQEEQRMLLERQMEEERQREELRLQEERRQQEEAHRKEEQRKREEIRSLEDQKRKEEEHKQQQEAQQYKVENKKLKPRSRTLDNATSYGYNQGWHDRPGIRYNGHTAESFGMQYRKPSIKTSSFNKEDKKPSNSTQYRRTVSDTAKKLQQPANKKSNVVKNGPLSPSSSSPSTPLISPSPSPRSSVSSAGPSPASSSTSLNKDPKSAGGSIPRRPRTIDKNPAPSSRPSHGNVSRPSTTSTLQSSRTTSRTTGVTNSAVKKNHVTPEEEFRQKHQQIKTQTQVESQKAKSQLESSTSRQRTSMSTTVPRSTNSTLSKRGGTVLTNSAIKAIESYKDSDPNYTIRRQMEHEHGEAKQIDCLRRTIESRLKVTLPDNLPETLRDGVLLCQLANSIRPRSVTSIHVPSPAVPKLTLAKCRKNVENFLEACRKLGVHREQICGAQDILEEKGVTRLAVTTSALIAVSTNPRSSAV